MAKALDFIEKTAHLGHTEAMLWLALAYFRGDKIFGITQDTEQGIGMVQSAAKLGDCMS